MSWANVTIPTGVLTMLFTKHHFLRYVRFEKLPVVGEIITLQTGDRKYEVKAMTHYVIESGKEFRGLPSLFLEEVKVETPYPTNIKPLR